MPSLHTLPLAYSVQTQQALLAALEMHRAHTHLRAFTLHLLGLSLIYASSRQLHIWHPHFLYVFAEFCSEAFSPSLDTLVEITAFSPDSSYYPCLSFIVSPPLPPRKEAAGGQGY